MRDVHIYSLNTLSICEEIDIKSMLRMLTPEFLPAIMNSV